jgi:hypothetical protein
MAWYLTKIAITAILIVAISEISRRSTLLGGILASVPLVSVLAMIWLYVDTHDTTRIASLSQSIFWLVLASLPLFVVLPLLLKKGINFYLSMGIGLTVMIACYFLLIAALRRFGISL